MVDYFENLFKAEETENIQEAAAVVKDRLSVENREILQEDFTKDKIALALKQMHTTKALGPDATLGEAFTVQKKSPRKWGLWKIGNGKQIKIWGYPWLSQQNGHKAWSPIDVVDRNATVSEIMNENGDDGQFRVREAYHDIKARKLPKASSASTNGTDESHWKRF
ncbi:hypothetical protein PIB30_036953 [Stylosanthes scabra]|uniref:Uncharacterized protein n=1 Tax=Stylosanthes scabra TaxID=79078 RepID=A0ABU6VDL2_9FABA|nr:hypothetical protein [Stylosanthes scabra]